MNNNYNTYQQPIYTNLSTQPRSPIFTLRRRKHRFLPFPCVCMCYVPSGCVCIPCCALGSTSKYSRCSAKRWNAFRRLNRLISPVAAWSEKLRYVEYLRAVWFLFFVPFSPPINTHRERGSQWTHTPLSLFKSFQHLYPGCNLQKCKKLFFLLCDTRPPWCILCLCAAKCEYLHVRPTVFFTLSLSFVAIQSVFRCFELTVFFYCWWKDMVFFYRPPT